MAVNCVLGALGGGEDWEGKVMQLGLTLKVKAKGSDCILGRPPWQRGVAGGREVLGDEGRGLSNTGTHPALSSGSALRGETQHVC